MELLAVRTARLVTLISQEEINPRGLAVYQSLVAGLVDKYSFSIIPDEEEPYDEAKGLVFEDGLWNGFVIDKLTILMDAIVIDTRSSTTDSEAIFEDAMNWAAESLGLTYKPEMVTRKAYVSELVFRSETGFNLNPALKSFSEKLSKSVNQMLPYEVNYEFSGLVFYFDTTTTTTPPSAFRIERLLNTSYSQNKYYSHAPLSTEEHIKFLEELEAIAAQT